ncbi:MAG: peptidase [Anaerofustis stercorihominis]|nr:peptidase [Anaerofustis stercorihominis]
MNTNYYYTQLTKQQQAAYYALLEGLNSLAPSFMVPRLDGHELFDIWFLLRIDHPEVFWSGGIRYKYYEDSAYVEVEPEYIFEKKKIKEHQKALASRVEKLSRAAAGLNDAEKLKYIHDFICTNVYYDKLKKQYSHEIIGPLGQGVGVCEGIAKSVKILCDALNIWCIIAISEANPEKGIKYRHAWNIVKINGKYYHLDATFDNSLGRGAGLAVNQNVPAAEDIRYDYFLLSDRQIYRDHEPVIWKVPECTDFDSFYYKQKKLSFTTIEDIRKRSLQAVKKGKAFTFHWRGDHLIRNRLQEILMIIEEEASAKSKHARVQVNMSQAVIRVIFSEIIPAEQLVEEDANEGELV